MSKKMVIVVTAVGVRKVVEKWLCENMTCELVVSRNARHECCVEVIYDSGNPSVLRTLLRSAVGEIIELCCTKNEKEHLLDYLCTIRVKRVIKEINDLKINKKTV